MTESRKAILRRIGKATVLYTVYLAVAFLLPLFTASGIFERYIQGFWTEDLYSAVRYGYLFLIQFSLISIFVLHDREYRARFLSCEERLKGFFAKLTFVLRSGELWCDVITLCALTAIMPSWAYTDMRYGFLLSVDAKWHFFIFLVVSFVTVTFFSLVAYCATLNWWARPREKRREILKKKDAIDWIKQVGFSVAMYLAGALVLPVVIPFVWSVMMTFWMLIVTMTIMVLLLILWLFTFKYIRAIYHRHRLMKHMKKALRGGFGRLVSAKGVYRSVFNSYEGANIVLEREGQKYFCKLITPLKRRYIVMLDEAGVVTYEHRAAIATHYKSERYYFDADNGARKIIVVNPGALHIYATDGLRNRELHSGDKVMGYYLYRSDNFINAILRQYL